MNIQKPANLPTSNAGKASAHTSPQAKASTSQEASGRRPHAFAHYMSSDGRPKEAFHPYRDAAAAPAAASSSALLAKQGIVRPLTLASLPIDPTKRKR